MKKETLEEFIDKVDTPADFDQFTFDEGIRVGAKWQQERSQQIVPFDAYNIEVFAIKPNEDGKLFAYIGYKITNGNFEFNIVPFTQPQSERMYSEEDMKQAFKNGSWVTSWSDMGIEMKYDDFETWFKTYKKK